MTPHGHLDLEAWLSARRAEIDALLDRRLQALAPTDDPGRLIEAMRYSLLAPGKRLRPLLALGAAEAVGAAVGDAVRISACAVELVHCYSLIHDDLPSMDDDDFRRGRPSCHKAFGEATAILAGDALLTLAFEWIADAALADDAGDRQNSRALAFVAASKALAAAAGMSGMVRGQARDLGEPPPGELAGLERLHREKTGALFRAAVEIGAHVGGGGPTELEALRRFADAFGLAFQHADDLDDREHADHAETARRRVRELGAEAIAALAGFGPGAEPLRAVARALAARAA